MCGGWNFFRFAAMGTDSDGLKLLWGLFALALVLILGWIFVERRYRRPLEKLRRLTSDLAKGIGPRTYLIQGASLIEATARHLEEVGMQLDDLQRQRRQEDFHLEVLLANMVEGVVVVDARHVIRVANAELAGLFGLDRSPVGQTLLEALRDPVVEKVVRKTMLEGASQRSEITLERASLGKSLRHFEVSVVAIRGEKGEAAGAVVVFHDISRLKQLELLRSELVANVSHELRTPLAIFRGYLETLLDHPELPPEELKRILGAMQRHSQRLNALVEDLLDLTRLEDRDLVGELKPVELPEFFAQILHDWKGRANAQPAEIELQISRELPALRLNPLRFEQVIFNLLENGVAYSNPPRQLAIRAQLEAGELVIRISDNGIGIPPADLSRIFDRFYRVDKGRSRVSGGTGLGLAISRQIVEAHGGTVQAESELGKGTTVVLRFPVVVSSS